MMLRLHIELHLCGICAVAHHRILFTIEIIGESCEGLRRSEGPDGTIPFTLAYTSGAEFRMPAFGRGETVRSRNTFLVIELKTCGIILSGIRKIELPWYIP